MSKISIEMVKNRGQLKTFLKFPFEIYRDDPNWIPHLMIERKQFFDPNKNPFFQHAQVKHYLAYKNNVIAGRISAIINHNHNLFHQDKTGFFGFFECIDDIEVATELFDTAADYLRSYGMNVMRGPCNFSTNDEIGFLVKGYGEPPTIMNTYTPPYYLELAEKYGMRKAMDTYGYYLDESIEIPERHLKLAERIRKKEGLTIRTIRMKELNAEVERVKKIYNQAWEENWGFVPLTDAEIDYLAEDFKLVLDPNIVFFAELNGEPIGFALALPDFNQILRKLNGKLLPFGIVKVLFYKKIRRIIDGIRVIILGVLPEYRGRGIDNLLYLEVINEGLRHGYKWAELGWILETNHKMNRALESLGAEVFRIYRIYDYPLK